MESAVNELLSGGVNVAQSTRMFHLFLWVVEKRGAVICFVRSPCDARTRVRVPAAVAIKMRGAFITLTVTPSLSLILSILLTHTASGDISISVKTMTGKTIHMQCPDTISVDEFRERIQDKEGGE